jgi:hypothetical protein
VANVLDAILGPLFSAGTTGAVVMLVIGMALVGLVFGPLAVSRMCNPAHSPERPQEYRGP